MSSVPQRKSNEYLKVSKIYGLKRLDLYQRYQWRDFERHPLLCTPQDGQHVLYAHGEKPLAGDRIIDNLKLLVISRIHINPLPQNTAAGQFQVEFPNFNCYMHTFHNVSSIVGAYLGTKSLFQPQTCGQMKSSLSGELDCFMICTSFQMRKIKPPQRKDNQDFRVQCQSDYGIFTIFLRLIVQ